MDEQSKTKRLNLMRYWLFGTFILVFAGVVTYMGLFTDRNGLRAVQLTFPIWGLTGLLCVLIFYGYKFLYLKNK